MTDNATSHAPNRKRQRRNPNVEGELAPERVYTTEGVMRACGIGTDQLIDARASGIVKAYFRGTRVYYKGSELIAWILSGVPRKQ